MFMKFEPKMCSIEHENIVFWNLNIKNGNNNLIMGGNAALYIQYRHVRNVLQF